MIVDVLHLTRVQADYYTSMILQQSTRASICSFVRACISVCVCVPPAEMIMRTVIAVCIDEGGMLIPDTWIAQSSPPRRVKGALCGGLSLDALSQ